MCARTVRISDANRPGVATPQVSGTLIQSTPTSETASITSARYSGSVRVASIGENITSAPDSAARSTLSTERSITASRLACIESSIWTSLVDANTWTRSTPASMAASTSFSTTRASPQTVVSAADAMSRTAVNSASEFTGKPASITSTPALSSAAAISRLSS